MNDTDATEDQEQPAKNHERKARVGGLWSSDFIKASGNMFCINRGRTYDRSRPNRSKRQKSACQGGPSTYDFAEHDAGAQSALGAVVRHRNVAVR
jgi:hypothetical protein